MMIVQLDISEHSIWKHGGIPCLLKYNTQMKTFRDVFSENIKNYKKKLLKLLLIKFKPRKYAEETFHIVEYLMF